MLKGKKVIVLAEKEYQELEFWYPFLRLKEAGAEVKIVGPEKKEYKGKYGYPVDVDASISEVSADQCDAVIIPGGWAPDFLRRDEHVLKLVSEVFRQGKVVAAICHAGSVLVSAGVLRGRRVTGFRSIKDDLVSAGAQYLDQEVVIDGNLITSRVPADLPAFCRAIVEALSADGPT